MFALGKAIFVLFMPCLSVYHFPSQSWSVLYKGFSYHRLNHSSWFYLPFSILPCCSSLFPSPLRSSSPLFLPILTLSCPPGSEKISPHSFWTTPFSLSLIQSGSLLSLYPSCSDRLRSDWAPRGVLISLTPPLEVTKAANCFCLWLKLCRGTHGSGI